MAQKAGPKSALKGGVGSHGEGAVGTANEAGAINYSVQCHDDDKGLFVIEPISAKSGDEAAQICHEKHGYKGMSVRGVTPYSDPDPNSLGGERDAAAMIQNAANPGAIVNTLGTEANAKATRELGKADIKELGE